MPPKNILNERFFFDFARQNQKKKRSFIILFVRLGRRNTFHTTPPAR